MPTYSDLDLLRDKGLQKELLLERWKDWLTPEADDKFGKLNDDNAKLAMAILMENQWQHQKKSFGPDQMMLDTATADEALITRLALPMVRRAYAQVFSGPWSSIQPMSQPTSYVFYIDFQREGDGTNILSVEYNYAITAEGGVPPKMKIELVKQQINALKQAEGVSWTQEAEEDARNVLGIDVESEIMNAAMSEFVRNLLGRHLKEIYNATTSFTSQGTSLLAPWNANLTVQTIAAQGGTSVTDYKSVIYNTLINADVSFQKANRAPSNGIVAGYGLAGLLQKMLTATYATQPDGVNNSSVGITNYGNYSGRWNIQGTDLLPDDKGFLYREDTNPLFQGHVYAPYIPITAMPKVYASYNASTGAYANTDTWTRNIRERSASIVVRPYAFAGIAAASLVF
jgi:hypothetical protein